MERNIDEYGYVQDIKIKNDEKQLAVLIKKIGENSFILRYGNFPSIKDTLNEKNEELIFSTAKEALNYVVKEEYLNSNIKDVSSSGTIFISKNEILEITNTQELKIN